MVDHDGNGEHESGRTRAPERLLSGQCRACGAWWEYAGTGRRPRYCSAACRQRAWSLRQAAEQLQQPDPLPKVVREVVERTTEAERIVPAPAPPRRAVEWVPLLAHLEHQVRHEPWSLVRGREEFQELAAAVQALHGAFAWLAPEGSTASNPPPSSPATEPPDGLSRQQRRARERARRKQR